jgi:hypothetical protein
VGFGAVKADGGLLAPSGCSNFSSRWLARPDATPVGREGARGCERVLPSFLPPSCCYSKLLTMRALPLGPVAHTRLVSSHCKSALSRRCTLRVRVPASCREPAVAAQTARCWRPSRDTAAATKRGAPAGNEVFWSARAEPEPAEVTSVTFFLYSRLRLRPSSGYGGIAWWYSGLGGDD